MAIDPTRLPRTETTVRDADWALDDLSGQVHERTAFSGVDLTEATSTGAVFADCVFTRCRFNAGVHVRTAMTNCVFVGCSFFEVRLEECKLVGSVFEDCTFGLVSVVGGDWSFVSLAGADLRKARITGVRMREADLAGVRAARATITGTDLGGASLQRADLSGADLRGSDLTSLDPLTATVKGAVIDSAQAVQIAGALGLDVR
jgi:fluoroquinolone resistance protein